MTFEGLKLLTTLYSDLEAEMVLSILRSAEIEGLKNHRGTGTIIDIGNELNYQPTELYVKEEDYEKAMVMIDENAILEGEES